MLFFPVSLWNPVIILQVSSFLPIEFCNHVQGGRKCFACQRRSAVSKWSSLSSEVKASDKIEMKAWH